jgi:serine-type D-Ala-D-Ala carboxypeptidase/endopeptidase (penicillin-binding protein 4)
VRHIAGFRLGGATIGLGEGFGNRRHRGGWRGAAALTALALTASAAWCAPLDAEAGRVLSTLKLNEARVALCAVDVDRGEIILSRNEREPLIPASNMKVLTSGAALLTLGSNFTFRTELMLVGDRLVIKGDGDPALGDPEILERAEPRMTVDDLLGKLAESVANAGGLGGGLAGGKAISEIIADDRVFDREYVHPSWPENQLQHWYCAQVSGLNFHANVLYFFPAPGRDGVGSLGTYTVSPFAPSPVLEIENKLRTVRQGDNLIAPLRQARTNRFTLSGEVRVQSQVPVRVTTNESATLFGQLLADRLVRRGVTIAGSSNLSGAVRGVRLADDRDEFAGARTIAVVTTPIRDVVRRCNQDSHNLYADALCKRVGHEITNEPGSWSNGGAVIRMLLTEKLGPEFAASTTIADGSGMSRQNLVTAETLARWLSVIAKSNTDRIFTDSMAEPGEGTLQRRFQNVKLRNELHAKSGYIRGVRCLSGYVIAPGSGADGDPPRRVAFSILVNDAEKGEEDSSALKLHEEVVKMLDRWLSTRIAGEAQAQVGG